MEAVVIGGFIFHLVQVKCKNKKCKASFKALKTSKQQFCSANCAGIELPLQNYNYTQRVQKLKRADEMIVEFYKDSEDDFGV